MRIEEKRRPGAIHPAADAKFGTEICQPQVPFTGRPTALGHSTEIERQTGEEGEIKD